MATAAEVARLRKQGLTRTQLAERLSGGLDRLKIAKRKSARLALLGTVLGDEDKVSRKSLIGF
jgi:hypothetical protein